MGVAHDFNNLLTAIVGHAQLARQMVSEGDPCAAELDGILTVSRRAAALVRRLLTFSRRRAAEPRPVDLHALVLDLEGLLRRLIGEHVSLETGPRRSEAVAVRADPSTLEQVLVNLVVNARDAMPRGGTIRIAVETTARDGVEYGVVAVSDTGEGISPELVPRLFEPFFTTKESVGGTGMGLSSSLELAREAGGFIDVESRPGAGATFRVGLPRTAWAPERSAAPPEAAPAVSRRGSVLLVEDDALLRSVVVRILRRLGYRVAEANDGHMARTLFEAQAEPFDVLLTDVVMPHIGGVELAQLLRARHPALRVVLMSGYGGESVDRLHATMPDAVYLPKPFTLQALARALHPGGAPEAS